MKGSSRRDALTAKFLLPPYALESSASTVGPKPRRAMHRDPRAVREGAEQPPTRSRAVAGGGRDEDGLQQISARFPPRVEPTSL